MDYLRPSPRFWPARRALLLACTAPLVLLAAGLALLDGVTAAAAVLLVGAAAIATAGLALHRRVSSWGYAEREDDLVLTRGVLVRRLTVVPYGRMQYLDVTAGPVDRVFGLATVRLHTAAAATDARLPGLGAEVAAALRDRLAELGSARSTGL